LLIAPIATAGPGFIGSSRVSVDESGDEPVTTIDIRFNCKAQYLRHEPKSGGDHLRIYLDPTAICNGVSPLVAESRSQLRPFNADSAHLLELEYEGDTAAGSVLTLSFSEPVAFSVEMSPMSFDLSIHVHPTSEYAASVDTPEPMATIEHRRITQPVTKSPDWVINLASFRRIPTIADAPNLQLRADQRLYYYEVSIDGSIWYRLRLGDFDSGDSAKRALDELGEGFPGAWIDQIETDGEAVALTVAAPTINTPNSKVDSLMEDARKSIVAGDTSRAIQIYTKILQMPEHPRHPEAQEYLALARERKGQLAHARAEYQRYLSLYPDNEGATRVRQRLAALLASGATSSQSTGATSVAQSGRASRQSDWRLLTYFSQYYRRDANQQNDSQQIISQSALYSDVNFDARRRGERFDFSSRLSAGYRSDFLDGNVGSGDSLRVSYAYADLADAKTGLRGRIGRQSRNTGGILGRFDGINIGYQASERILLNAVTGKPAYSASDGIDSARTFYGTSISYGPLIDGLELGLFFVQQDIEGVDDRQAVGGEFRYFGPNQSFWGLLDYDTSYEEIGSAFLQGSWRFGSRLTLHGSLDRRHSPFLSTGNALIGQPVATFKELLELYPLQEIRQFGRDRSPVSTTYTIGVSHSLAPKLQINADINQTAVDATPESGGVAATPSATYRYFSSSLVASSLLREGDVTIFGIRYSDSDTSRVISLTIDSRYPLGRTWRINPRLRVDQRQRSTRATSEWIYTPGIRVQYRRSQKFRIEFEVGKQFARQENDIIDLDRESYFVSLGYQVFF